MQSSIWKLVSILGVVGIGSLVVVEVQRQLPPPPGILQAEEKLGSDESSATQPTPEQTTDAPLSQSPFGQNLAGGDAQPSAFNFSEPSTAAAAQQAATPPQVGMFHESETDTSAHAVPVDNTVRRDELAQGGNPFEPLVRSDEPAPAVQEPADAGEIHTVAASRAVASGFEFSEATTTAAFQPAGSEQDDPFTADTTDESDNPFTDMSQEPDQFTADDYGDSPTTSPSPFEPGTNTISFRAPETEELVPVPPEARTETQPAATDDNRAAPMVFFGQQDDDQPVDGSDGEQLDSRSTPDADFDAPPFEDTVPVRDNAFDTMNDRNHQLPSPPNRTEAPIPELQATDAAPELSPFDFEVNAQPQPQQQPSATDDHGRLNLSPEPAVGPEVDSTSSGAFFTQDVDRAPATDASAPLSDTQSDAGDRDTLPFVEDMPADDADDNRGRFTPPPRNTDSSGLAIPGFGDDSLRPTPDDGSFNPRPQPDDSNAPRFDDEPLFNDHDNGTGFERPGDSGRDAQPGDPSGSQRDFDSRPPNAGSAMRQVSAVMRPHMTVEKAAPSNATVGVPVKYTITVKNEGQSAAYDVVVEDELPVAADVKSTDPRADFDQRTRKLSWLFDTLRPGEERTIQVTVEPTGEGTLDGVATVQFKAQVKSSTTISAPRLDLQLTGPAEVRIEGSVDLRYVISNTGTGEARDVFIRTVLPPGLKHREGNDLEYALDALRPGEHKEIVLTVLAVEPGEYRTVAEAIATGGAKSSDSSEISIVGQQLQLERRGAKRRFVGRTATYENIIQNETTFDAFDAEVVEQVPDGMKFVSATANGLYNPQDRTVTWKIDRLDAGKQQGLQIELIPLLAGDQKSVVVVIENAGFRSRAEDITSVQDLHNVSADISRLEGPMAVGETFGFSISVDNRGTAEATDVELIVQVPAGIRIVGAGSRARPADLGPDNAVHFRTIARVPPNKQESFELRLQGQRPVQNGAVKAMVRYNQMQEPLVVSESVTVYSYGE